MKTKKETKKSICPHCGLPSTPKIGSTYRDPEDGKVYIDQLLCSECLSVIVTDGTLQVNDIRLIND